MSDEAELVDEQLPLEGAGQRLSRAREAAGKSIDQIAAETRIPIRHLEVIEAGDFAALPARTYAIGFSRTYARAVGENESEIADMVRTEMSGTEYEEAHRPAKFEPGDPARVPSRGLAWFSLFAVILLVVGALAFFRDYFFPGSGPAALDDPATTAAAQPNKDGAAATASATPNPTGQVVFTSLEDGVWVKFYDGAGERLMEKQMAKGERYSVPADAVGPQIWTGQPEALSVSIGGKTIGNLSNESQIIRDVDISAGALAERLKQNSVASSGSTTAPATPQATPPTTPR